MMKEEAEAGLKGVHAKQHKQNILFLKKKKLLLLFEVWKDAYNLNNIELYTFYTSYLKWEKWSPAG